jgi:RHS repeat-associated protein
MNGCMAGQFKYAPLQSPVTLTANTSYYVVSYEAGGDLFRDWTGTWLTTTSVATLTTAVYTPDGGQSWGEPTGAGNSYVAVDIKYLPVGTTAEVKWMVADQLGTPRMVVDKSGSLAGVTRHDYLPFGEEIAAGTGGRTTQQGYSQFDGVRQKWVGYERDGETGLDYAQARYYGSTMGRFTSVDPVMMTEDRLYDPQQINLYAYCRNNPLAFIDPTGETISFKDKDSEKAFNEYEKFINKDPKKYASEIATLKQLRASDVNYIPVLGGKQSSETVEGNTVPDAAGENILVRIRNVGGPQGEKLDRNGRFAHELEHARQFDNGELAFVRTDKGAWTPLYRSYDIYDEVNAYNSILRVAPPIKDTPLLKSLRDDRLSDSERARTLTSRAYTNLKDRQVPSNVDRAWGAKPGELVRPAANRPFFGRVYDPSRGQR